MHELKIRKIGNSLGLVLPKETLEYLKVGEGDHVYLTQATDGSYRLTPYNEEFAQQMALAEEIMRQDRDILREIPKRQPNNK